MEDVYTEKILPSIRKISNLKKQRDDLKKKSAIITSEINDLKKDVVEYFQTNEMQSVNIEGIGTVYLRSIPRVKIIDEEEVQQWLEKKGILNEMMSFSKTRFASFYKEMFENNQELPENVELYMQTDVIV